MRVRHSLYCSSRSFQCLNRSSCLNNTMFLESRPCLPSAETLIAQIDQRVVSLRLSSLPHLQLGIGSGKPCSLDWFVGIWHEFHLFSQVARSGEAAIIGRVY